MTKQDGSPDCIHKYLLNPTVYTWMPETYHKYKEEEKK